MDGISKSRGWDKAIPHEILPLEKLVLSDKLTIKSNLLSHLRENKKLVTISK